MLRAGSTASTADQLVHISYVALKNSDEADEVLNELPKSLQDLKVNSIRSTPDHPFYINKSLDETVAAENILTGDLLYSISDSQDDDSEGPVFLVVNVSHIDTEEPVTVYNISVEGNHNYYVSSHDILVHNCNDPLDTAAKRLTPYGTFLDGALESELMIQSAREGNRLKTQYHSMKFVGHGILFVGEVISLGTASPIVSIFKGSSKKGIEVAIKGGAESAIKHMGKTAPQKTVKIANTSTALSKHIQSDAASAIRDQLSKSQAAKLGHKPPSGGFANEGISRVRRINGRLPVNSKYAGKMVPLKDLPVDIRNKYPHSVHFSGNGFPDFSRYSVKNVRINLGKTRTTDFARADRAAGFSRSNPRPKGYTWHHHQDSGYMQLIPTDLHNAIKHTGGIATKK